MVQPKPFNLEHALHQDFYTLLITLIVISLISCFIGYQLAKYIYTRKYEKILKNRSSNMSEGLHNYYETSISNHPYDDVKSSEISYKRGGILCKIVEK